METVAQKQWLVLGRDEEAVRMEEIPTGEVHRFPSELLPDDVEAGDNFRLVAQLERSDRGPGRDVDGVVHPAFGEAIETLSG